jgi:4-hydroxy-3-methylbut-2-enyl diphosphate reductase
LDEAKLLVDFIDEKRPEAEFYSTFEGKYSKGFDLKKDLEKIGVVNQTTMLASETEEISNFLKQFIINKRGQENYKDFFADTRDTLCYATNENQKATYGLLEVPADLAIVVGGYNSSNTSHLVELCEKVLPTYFVKSEQEILSKERIRHFNYNDKTTSETDGFLPNKEKLKVIITSGASCPDAVVDRVLQKLLSYFDNKISVEEALAKISQS